MTSTASVGRKCVREFFEFTLIGDELSARDALWVMVAGAGALGLVIGYVWAGVTTAVLIAALCIAAAYSLDRWLARRDVEQRRASRDTNHTELTRLADQVRQVQANDVSRALLRVFEHTQVDQTRLRVLEQQYRSDKEEELFGEDNLRDRLGDLHNKSIRMISVGDFTNPATRTIRWMHTRQQEAFFNPTRLVALFLTEMQLIICDVQFDSMDGDLRETIQRISLSNVVSIEFTEQRIRLPTNVERMVQAARDLGYSEREAEDIRASLLRPENGAVPEWVHEQTLSSLGITRTDSVTLSVPIRSALFFGKHKSALDEDALLSPEEIKVDRMVNELNRLVEGGRGSPTTGLGAGTF